MFSYPVPPLDHLSNAYIFPLHSPPSLLPPTRQANLSIYTVQGNITRALALKTPYTSSL